MTSSTLVLNPSLMTRFTIKKNIVMLSLKKRHEWLPLFPVIDRIDGI